MVEVWRSLTTDALLKPDYSVDWRPFLVRTVWIPFHFQHSIATAQTDTSDAAPNRWDGE
jgi:hypothetical protein